MSYASEFQSIKDKFEAPKQWLEDEPDLVQEEINHLVLYKIRLWEEMELADSWIKQAQEIKQNYGNT